MIYLKTEEEIDKIKKSCIFAVSVLKMIEPYIKPGISTLELNNICHEYIVSNNAIPAPLNYKGFPKSICTSINNVVCHGIPSASDILKEGDIINIDITTIVDGYYGDVSKTYAVGKITNKAAKLLKVTEECLYKGIKEVVDNGYFGNIGYAIQTYAESNGFSVVREYVGHGIGKNFHEEPQVLHYGYKNTGIRIKRGMVFTIEPMINEGTWKTYVKEDGWTVVTQDGKLSAQFEHTIAVRNNGKVEVLTQL